MSALPSWSSAPWSWQAVAKPSFVYVVMGEASRLPVAAFTNVEHLAGWLCTRHGLSMLQIWRLPNGGGPGKVMVNAYDIMEGR
jgi:hypothetical protein